MLTVATFQEKPVTLTELRGKNDSTGKYAFRFVLPYFFAGMPQKDGQAFLDARKTEVAALMARLAEMASERARFDNAPVRRAMMNLRAVLMHRLGEETVKPETLHAVTAIIDEAAQRIERL